MSRSNNRIPKQFLKDTDACDIAQNCWRKDIHASELVRKYIAGFKGDFLSESHAFGLRMARVWIIKMCKKSSVEYFRWVDLGRPLYSEPTDDYCVELERHVVIFVTKLLKEWRHAKLATA